MNDGKAGRLEKLGQKREIDTGSKRYMLTSKEQKVVKLVREIGASGLERPYLLEWGRFWVTWLVKTVSIGIRAAVKFQARNCA